MVITLKDGSRLELRGMPNFRQVYDYINDKISPQAQAVSGALGEV
jgi:hypothetical protein